MTQLVKPEKGKRAKRKYLNLKSDLMRRALTRFHVVGKLQSMFNTLTSAVQIRHRNEGDIAQASRAYQNAIYELRIQVLEELGQIGLIPGTAGPKLEKQAREAALLGFLRSNTSHSNFWNTMPSRSWDGSSWGELDAALSLEVTRQLAQADEKLRARIYEEAANRFAVFAMRAFGGVELKKLLEDMDTDGGTARKNRDIIELLTTAASGLSDEELGARLRRAGAELVRKALAEEATNWDNELLTAFKESQRQSRSYEEGEDEEPEPEQNEPAHPDVAQILHGRYNGEDEW